MKRSKILSAIFMVFVLFSGTVLLTGCGDGSNSNQKQIPTVNVQVFKVEPINYSIRKILTGRVIASRIAEIRPQVSGIILKKEFTESTDVKTGQSLYQIDPAIYQAAYDIAIANSESVKAKANIAQLTLKRYSGLLMSKSISQQQYDESVANVKQANAQVMVAEADVNKAKVNLDYSRVYSPIDGYIGKSNITEGALVSVGQTTPLAVVQQFDPVYVDMTEAVTKYEQNQQNYGVLFQQAAKIPVEIVFSDGTKFNQTGYVKFSDKSVDETTGTVTLRAEFPNPLIINGNGSQQRRLLPGMFVKPTIIIGTIKNAVLVPQSGITGNAQGQYTAKVINADGLIEQRQNIEVYGGIQNYWIIKTGINIGDQVVVGGLMNLSTIPQGTPIKGKIIESMSLKQDEVDTMAAQGTN